MSDFTTTELSLRTHVERRRLEAFVSEWFGVEPDRIGSALDFWESSASPSEILLGLDVQWSDTGFRTLVSIYRKTDLPNVSQLKLAESASKLFNTDVAVGDFTEPCETAIDQFLVVTPDGRIYRAYATQNADVFEVEPCGPAESLADMVSALEADDPKTGD
jgi:hypothetical protein